MAACGLGLGAVGDATVCAAEALLAAAVLRVSFLANEDRKEEDDDCGIPLLLVPSLPAGGERGLEPRPVRSMLALFCCALT